MTRAVEHRRPGVGWRQLGPMTSLCHEPLAKKNSAGGALLQLYRNYPPGAIQTLWREYEHFAGDWR